MLRHPFYESQDFFLLGLLGTFHTIFEWCQVAFDCPGQADSEEKNTCLLGVGH